MKSICERETWDRFAHMWLIAISVALAAGVSSRPCVAQPATVGYQGQLKKMGDLFDGTAQFKFVILAAGQSLWSNDGTSVAGSEPSGSVDVKVNDGIFSIQLGQAPMVPLEAALLNMSSGVALRVWVNTGDGFDQLSDQPISSSVFSLHSESADGSPGIFTAEGGIVAGSGTAALRGDDNPSNGSATLTSNNDLVIGFRAFQGNNPLEIEPATFSNFQLGIGTLDPSASVDIQGEIRIRGGNPGTGRVLTSDADGLASWQEVGLPSGAIILWTGLSCPSGFTRFSAIDGKFLVSGPAYNPSAGGDNLIAPSGTVSSSPHTHTVPATSRVWGRTPGHAGGGFLITEAANENAQRATIDAPTSFATSSGSFSGEEFDNRPEFATILLCQKD